VAEIRAFRGLRYDPDRVALDDVVCPPYDVVGAADARAYRERSPHAAIHLELPAAGDGDPDDRYAAAAGLLTAWRSEDVLVRDDEPALYLIEHTFKGPDGWERTRRGFVCLLELADLAEGVVLPHEKTHRGPKEDRLALMRATHADISQVFMLYPDAANEVGAALAAAEPPPGVPPAPPRRPPSSTTPTATGARCGRSAASSSTGSPACCDARASSSPTATTATRRPSSTATNAVPPATTAPTASWSSSPAWTTPVWPSSPPIGC
jgi:hypothetical protein